MELWALYHHNTKLSPRIVQKVPLSSEELADLMLQPRPSRPLATTVKLPAARGPLKMPLEEALLKRRSTRSFADKAVALSEISTLLGLSHGISGQIRLERGGVTHSYALRTAPSAGALFPCELYVAASRVARLRKGLYHYSPERNELDVLALDDALKKRVDGALLGPEQFPHWAVALIITGNFARAITKYGERGYRYVLLDAGHIGQNIYLVATALGLGVVGVCGFYDEKADDLLSLESRRESTLYVFLLGATGRV